MPESNMLLGIILLVAAPALFILVLLLLRIQPQMVPGMSVPIRTDRNDESRNNHQAVLLVQEGGRIVYLNQLAREWFHLGGEEPDLERLARLARPTESFLTLCGGEGSVRLTLEGRSVEATSYFSPYGGARAFLLTLHRPQLFVTRGNAPGQTETSGQAFRIFTELSQAITASLDLEETLKAIFDGVGRLIPFDVAEINIWDSGNQFLIPYRFRGAYTDPFLERPGERYRIGEGLSGYLAKERKSLLLADVDHQKDYRPVVDRQRVPFRSYLGMPLLVAGELIGTIELGNLNQGAFSNNDQELLGILSGQAAVAVHNALLYRGEQQRAKELAGLANLAQAVHALKDPQDIFSRLTEVIDPLLNVELLGFLIYDESRRELAGQVPFLGLPPDVVAQYKVTIQPGSPAEAEWLSGKTIVTTDALHDPRLQVLGFNHITQAAGFTHTVLAPLSSSGRLIGYLQAATRRDGSPFDSNDLRLLSIITGQAGPLIDNVHLVQQSRRRAQRSETLRRIASLTGSSATIEEILKYTLIDLARLLQADVAAILLLEENRGELRLHKPSQFGFSPELANRGWRIPIDDPRFPETISGSQRQLLLDNLGEQELTILYQPFISSHHILSLIGVPLLVRDQTIGEILLGSTKAGFFSQDDLLSTVTAASQVAAAIDQAELSTQTDQSLRARVDQLMALSRISREINSTVELAPLIQRVYDELVRTTHADCGSIMVFQLTELQFEPPSVLLSLGETPEEGFHPLEKYVLDQGEAILISDFENLTEEVDRPDSNLPFTLTEWEHIQPIHPGIRSALLVPINYQGQVAGLIHLHGRAPGKFTTSELEITETLAVQAAIALGNAHRYMEQVQRSILLNRRVETLSKLFETAQVLQSEQPLDEILESIAYAIQESTPFDIVLISIYDDSDEMLHRTANAGVPLATMAELRARPQPWSHLIKLCNPKFCLGNTFFIPFEQMPLRPVDAHIVILMAGETTSQDENHWNPQDLLLLPLTSAAGKPLGLISVDAPRNNLRPDRPTLESLEIFGTQAALAIENYQKVQALRSRVEVIEGDLECAQQAAREAQNSLPALIQKNEEQALTIQTLSQRSQRMTAGLNFAELVYRQANRGDVLLSLGKELAGRMGWDTVLITEPGSEHAVSAGHSSLRLLHVLGEIPENTNPETFFGQRNPLRYSLQNKKTLLVNHLAENSEWKSSPLLLSLEARAFVTVPVILSNRVDSVLLALSHTPQLFFTQEDEQLFDLLAHQTASALQNLELLDITCERLEEVNLLLEFSRQLGSLEPASILQKLVESAMQVAQAAQAGVVALWSSAENCLIPQYATGYNNQAQVMQIHYRPGEGLAGQVFSSGTPARIDDVDFARHYNLGTSNLLHYRNACAGRSPVSCLVLPILNSTNPGENSHSEPSIGQPWGVLVLENFNLPAAFTPQDQALIASLTQQTALTLENARLYQASQQRASQMQTLTEVASTITSSLEPDELISTLLYQLQAIIPYNTGTLWLRDNSTSKDTMTVRAARGFAGSEQRVGISMAVDDSQLLHEMTLTGRPISVPNVREDSRFPALMEFEHFSWLGVPLIASREVIGVIALEKREPGYYTPEHIQMITTFAGQAAVAFENANLYQESLRRTFELDQRSKVLVMLNRLSVELSGSLDVHHILDSAVKELHQALECSTASAILLGSDGNASLESEFPINGQRLPVELPSMPLFEHIRESLGVFNCEDVSAETELLPLFDFLDERKTSGLMVIPLATGLNLHGLLLAHSSHPRRFEPEEVDLARTIGNQVAIAIQNARLFGETRRLTQDLEDRVDERTQELAREHQRTETLLRIITELSASLDLDQVLNRTLKVLNEMIDAEQITVLIVRPGEKKLHRVASIGYTEPVIEGETETHLEVHDGLAGWVIGHRQSVLIQNVLEDPRWVNVGTGLQTQHRSALGVPLMLGAESLGSMLLFHRERNHFSDDQLELVQAAANQVAVAVNNAELYRLIRDQAEDLGGMLRNQQVETSRSRAILEAVADGVLVTDAQRRITLFNASAEKILGLQRKQVIGQSLEYFSGLFGKAAQKWRETIATWSLDPTTYQSGETFSEQITLENGAVVSVRLAPVIMRNDFLGTVSIFSDITHQVEVDRLKSEFVATVSHELRTPMTSIKGYVEIMLMGAAGAISDQQRRFLETVKINTERLAILVNDLLDISRIESGKVKLALQPLQLHEITEEVIEDILRRAREEGKTITIEKEIPKNLHRVVGDPERVRQIVDNLLDNAYSYNYPDGHISIQMQQKDGEVLVHIKDTGFGIPLKEQPRIFERFFRGEGPLVLGVPGTGLGLSIVQNLVHMHRGRIWLHSTGLPGEGSTFSFCLPVYNPENIPDEVDN